MTTETVESHWSQALREDVEIQSMGYDEWGNEEFTAYLDGIQYTSGTLEQVENSLFLYSLFTGREVDRDGF